MRNTTTSLDGWLRQSLTCNHLDGQKCASESERAGGGGDEGAWHKKTIIVLKRNVRLWRRRSSECENSATAGERALGACFCCGLPTDWLMITLADRGQGLELCTAEWGFWGVFLCVNRRVERNFKLQSFHSFIISIKMQAVFRTIIGGKRFSRTRF